MSPVAAESQAVSAAALPWTTIIIVAVVLLCAAAVVAFVLWRRKRGASASRAAAGGSLDDKLGDIYKPFYRELPMTARFYPTVVVVGAAGVGKSHLIDRHIDWRGQARQFHPSRTDQSLMQLYLGSGVIVQELSAPLLRDVSRDAERALSRLWHRLARRPVDVVVVIKATELATSTPQSLVELAQLVRGKLDLVSQHGNRTLCVRLCLTHLDQVDGYSGFSRLLRSRNHTSRVDPTGGELQITDLDGALVPFDAHLALALTTCTPDEFRDVVDFYNESPALFHALSPFLYHLRGGDDRFAREYPIEGMYFGSANPDEFVGNPFAVDRSGIAGEISQSRKRHLTACAAILLVAVFGLGMMFGWHEDRLTTAEAAVASFDAVAENRDRSARALDTAQKRAHQALASLHDSNILWLSAAFEERKDTLAEAYRDSLREHYLLPALAAQTERGKLLYAASLIYAARTSELGRTISADPRPWMSELSLPRSVVEDYVQASESVWDGDIELRDTGGGGDRAWADFLRRLQADIAAERISDKELAALVDALAGPLALGNSARYQAIDELVALIAQDADLSARLAPLLAAQAESEWISRNYDALKQVSDMVRRGSLKVAENVAAWTLTQLLAELRKVAGAPEKTDTKAAAGQDAATGTAATDTASTTSSTAAPASGAADASTANDTAASPAPVVYSFTLADGTVDIPVDGWNELLMRSRAGLLVHRFIAQVDTSERSPFFTADAYYPNAGATRGTTRGPTGVIPGLYTARAFNEAVLPVLADASRGLADILLADSDRADLEDYIETQINTYATEYSQEIDSYYRSFSFGSPSLDELIFELQAMSRPTGWFVGYLGAVADNANLSLPGTGRFFDPMAQGVEPYQAFVALMTEAKGAYPQLDPYLAILSDLATTLEGSPGAPAAEDGLELDTAGTLALPVVQGTEQPLTNKVRAFLATAAIENRYHYPFLAPVERAYALGYSNIESAVASAWQNAILGELQPVLDKFPFDPAAKSDASVAEVEDWFLPATGRFWQAFATYIEPVAEKKRGVWRMRSPIGAPRGMLATINDAATLSATLWDAKGKRQLLTVSLTPQPLPTDAIDGRVSILAYVKSGASIIYGFNQKPLAHDLPLEWWSEATASVGVRLESPGTGTSQTGSVDIVESLWSFHRLVRAARTTKEGKATWSVPVGTSAGSKTQTLDMSVVLQEDPFEIFDLQ